MKTHGYTLFLDTSGVATSDPSVIEIGHVETWRELRAMARGAQPFERGGRLWATNARSGAVLYMAQIDQPTDPHDPKFEPPEDALTLGEAVNDLDAATDTVRAKLARLVRLLRGPAPLPKGWFLCPRCQQKTFETWGGVCWTCHLVDVTPSAPGPADGAVTDRHKAASGALEEERQEDIRWRGDEVIRCDVCDERPARRDCIRIDYCEGSVWLCSVCSSAAYALYPRGTCCAPAQDLAIEIAEGKKGQKRKES